MKNFLCILALMTATSVFAQNKAKENRLWIQLQISTSVSTESYDSLVNKDHLAENLAYRPLVARGVIDLKNILQSEKIISALKGMDPFCDNTKAAFKLNLMDSNRINSSTELRLLCLGYTASISESGTSLEKSMDLLLKNDVESKVLSVIKKGIETRTEEMRKLQEQRSIKERLMEELRDL